MVYSVRKRSIRANKDLPLERYLDFLPLDEVEPSLSLGEGRTPLVPLSKPRREFGGARLFAKVEMSNPTSSFKDRGTSVVVQKSRALGLTRIGTVSTGNMAASTAAYAARAGLRAFILVKGDTSAEKIKAAAVYAPSLVKVEGDYGAVFERSLALGRSRGIYFANSVDPIRVEGYKLTAYEVFEQLGRRAPRYLIVPVSSGGHVLGLLRGFLDLRQAGLIASLPVIVGVQASGCAPLARAFEEGLLRYERFRDPQTIAHAISNPTPPGGNVVLKLIREHQGLILDVTDKMMLEAQRLLAEGEGVFCLPDSATTLAALIKLAGRARFSAEDDIVLVITGTGLKNLDDLDVSPGQVVTVPLPELADALARFEG